MHRIQQTRTLVAGATGAICASQTPGGAGNLTINGTLASGGVATLAAQQLIGFTSGSNISNRTLTITGTDDYGRVISETLTGPNGNTVNSVLNYRTVTQISISGAAAGAMTVDTVTVGASAEIPLDGYLNPFNVSLGCTITGTVNATAQFTLDDVFGSAPGPFIWYPVNGMVGMTATTGGALTSRVSAVRLLTNSGAGTAIFSVLQSGMVC